MLRNYWISLSFANLVYMRAWSDLLPANPRDAFFRKTLAGPGQYFAVTADVLVLSLLAFLVISFAPKIPRWLQRILILVPIAMVALAIRSVLVHPGIIVRDLTITLPLLIASLTLAFFSRAVPVLRTAALAATPCLAVTLAGSLIDLTVQRSLPSDPPRAAALPGSPPVRVLWILFDDWDELLTFADRPSGVHLPAIDDLAGRSFNATRALAVQAGRMPVEEMSTFGAIPSLLYGKFIVHSGLEDAGTMNIDFANNAGDPVALGAGTHIFARIRASGWNAAAAGWYLPYCRVFSAQLTDCYWDVRYLQVYSASPDFAHAALDETRMLFETMAFSPFGPSLVDARHFGEYEALMAHARRYAADPSLGLAFIHLNVPHAPYFYDPEIGPSLRYANWRSLYTEGLEWVDRSVAEIVATVNRSGLGGRTAIVMSSDHPFRYSVSQDPHVPFIVHLPGNDSGVFWQQEFSAIRTADLILAIAAGELKSPQEVAEFLRRG